MVGIVIVSHSAKVAEGICEMAAQMARAEQKILAAGGTADGGIAGPGGSILPAWLLREPLRLGDAPRPQVELLDELDVELDRGHRADVVAFEELAG